MAVRFSTGLRTRLLGENGVDTGANGLRGIFKDGVIHVYTGNQPASADAAPTGTFLGAITVNGGSFTHGVATNGLEFDAPVAGVLSKAAAETWKLTGAAAGTAGWARFKTNANDDDSSSTTQPRMDMAVSGTGGSGEAKLSTLSIVVSGSSTVDSFTITMAGA